MPQINVAEQQIAAGGPALPTAAQATQVSSYTASALSGLSEATGQASDVFTRMSVEHDSFVAQDRLNQFDTSLNDLAEGENGFKTKLVGGSAVDQKAVDGVKSGYTSALSKATEGLTPAQRKVFDQASRATSISFQNGLSRHVSTEAKQYRFGVAQTAITNSANSLYRNFDDPELAATHRSALNDSIAAIGALKGEAPETIALNQKAAYSNVLSRKVDQLQTSKDYVAARRLIATNRDQFTTEDLDKLETTQAGFEKNVEISGKVKAALPGIVLDPNGTLAAGTPGSTPNITRNSSTSNQYVNKEGNATGYVNTQASAEPVASARYAAGIASAEGAGYNEKTKLSGSAGGRFQYIDATWNNYGGYKHAKDAPPEVQEKRFAEDTAIRAKKYNNNEDLMALAHFRGDGWATKLMKEVDPEKRAAMMNEKVGKNLTPAQYLAKYHAGAGSGPAKKDFTPANTDRWVGTKTIQTPTRTGCADTVSQVIRGTYDAGFPHTTYTPTLKTVLGKRGFQEQNVSTAAEGDIIMFATEPGKTGHVGIVGPGGKILSNSSSKGTMQYTHKSVDAFVRDGESRGLKTSVYKPPNGSTTQTTTTSEQSTSVNRSQGEAVVLRAGKEPLIYDMGKLQAAAEQQYPGNPVLQKEFVQEAKYQISTEQASANAKAEYASSKASQWLNEHPGAAYPQIPEEYRSGLPLDKARQMESLANRSRENVTINTQNNTSTREVEREQLVGHDPQATIEGNALYDGLMGSPEKLSVTDLAAQRATLTDKQYKDLLKTKERLAKDKDGKIKATMKSDIESADSVYLELRPDTKKTFDAEGNPSLKGDEFVGVRPLYLGALENWRDANPGKEPTRVQRMDLMNGIIKSPAWLTKNAAQIWKDTGVEPADARNYIRLGVKPEEAIIFRDEMRKNPNANPQNVLRKMREVK
jgi:hypothetical protein